MPNRLNDFALNSGERYYTVADPANYDPDRTSKVPHWSLTIHEITCRFARNPDRYISKEYVRDLVTFGLELPTERKYGTRYVWKACRVCKTALISSEQWKVIGKEWLDAKQAEENAQRNEQQRKWALQKAEADRRRVAQDARNAVILQHIEAIEAAEREAEAKWDAENPERLALINEGV